MDDTRWTEFGPGAVGVGWELGVMGLAQHITSGAANDPGAWATWTASDDGRAFITLSSEGWRDASIAAGTDEDAARAAGARTTAFYTGAPEEEPSGA